jgi:iron complex transport system ATP-binding protein
MIEFQVASPATSSTVPDGVFSLEARNLSFQRGRCRLLCNVSLEVRPGEVLALVGPNGAGKTTLLHALAGDIKPTHGEVLLGEQHLSKFTTLELAGHRAVLTQHTHLNFAFSALEVVLLGRHPHGDENLELARACLHHFDALHLAERLYPTLSGGEQRRVQLARVWAQLHGMQHPFLLLDEPTANLDLAHQHHTLDLARGLARGGAGVLCVLHDLNLAASYADSVAVLRDGKLRAIGSVRETLTPALILDVFGLRVVVREDPQTGLLIVPLPNTASNARR